MEKRRIGYFDFLRGIAIIFVVGIHTFVPDSFISICFRQVLNLAVPLFLAISGYFIGKKDLATWNKYKYFLKKQLPRVYIPTLFLSIPWALISYKQGHTFGSITLNFFLCGFSVFYFVALIIQLYIITPIINNILNRRWSFYLLLSFSFVGILVWTYQKHILMLGLPMTLSGAPFPKWLIYYCIGILVSKGHSLGNYKTCRYIILMFSLVLSYIECVKCPHYHHLVPGMKPTAFLYSIVALTILMDEDNIKKYNNIKSSAFAFIEKIGRRSFFIYLVHCLIMFVLKDYLSLNIWCFKWIIVLAATLAITYILIYSLPTKFHKYIGLN